VRNKKLLLLGGSAQQVIAIKTAKRLGYETVLCDYLNDNPGQLFADSFYLVSTTDRDAVLDVAKNESISGILAYASDPAAPTAAYVAEKLGLPTSPYRSVNILCNKDKFRSFLIEHDFHSPRAKGYDNVQLALSELGSFKYPIFVKPVDSSGSKGVARLESREGAESILSAAMSMSRRNMIIIEEYVPMVGYQVAGDGLSINGELVFRCYANDHFNARCLNPFVPISASFPFNMPEGIQRKIDGEIQRLLKLLHMGTCTYNFDIRIDKEHNIYLMEIAPRSGGNYIPQVIKKMTGVDLVEYAILGAMGEKLSIPEYELDNKFYSYFAIHSYHDGVLDSIIIDESFRANHIVEDYTLVRRGDQVNAFVGANTTLGILIMQFNSMDEMLHCMDNPDEWITVKLQN